MRGERMTKASAEITAAVTHHVGCTPDYPEKINEEPPQFLTDDEIEPGVTVWTCVDCGAYVVVETPIAGVSAALPV